MTDEEFSGLGPGDLIQAKPGDGLIIMVSANYGGRVTAVRTFDLTNPIEWDIVRKVETAKTNTQEQ